VELRVCTACRQIRSGYTTCPACHLPLTLSEERLFLGETFGKYRLERVLGAGGMGVVYRAIHVTLQRPAAVKIVLPQRDDGTFQKRFLREAQVLAELKHPNIVEVYDFDVSAWGAPYYVMEYLHGATLGAVVRGQKGALPLPVLSAILGDVGAGLAFAHRRGIVHRDLKPDNLFVVEFDGRATTKILDFGIAKVLSADKAATHLTTTGEVVGTPHYLAPEQLLGRDIGTHTDQYALALIVAELLSGRPVRAGKTLGEILREAIAGALGPEQLPAGVPEGLRAALARATQPEPGARFPDVAAFLVALELPAPEEGSSRLAAIAQDAATMAASAASIHTPTQTVGRALTTAPAEARETVALGGATATVPGGAAPQAAPPLGRRGRRVLAIAFVAVLLLGLAGLWRARHPATGEARKVGAAGGAEGVGRRVQVPVPPDVTAVLARKDDTLILRGGAALYLLLRDGTQPATRIALGATETVLGAADAGDLWLRDGTRILRLDPLKQTRTIWVEGLPGGKTGPALQVSRSGRFVASAGPRGVDVCEVHRLECTRRFSAPREPDVNVVMALSDGYLVVAQGLKEITAWRLPDGRRTWSAPLKEPSVRVLALFDDADLVAVAGWFDHVDVHEMRQDGFTATIPCPEGAADLAWIGDHPTLVLGGPRGLAFWRQGSSALPARGGVSDESASLLATGGGIVSLRGGEHVVDVLDYGSLPPPERVALGKVALWAVASAPDGSRVYVGGSDGTLHVLAPPGKPESVSLHTDGITDLVVRGENMASTSDDKTLAVWQLPRLNVLWRSKAHAFLVNQMWLAGEPPSLWTSSSDGTVKRWGFPQVEEQESVDVSRLLGRKVELQALWASPAGDRVVAGTWDHALAVLSRPRGGPWKAESLAVASQGLYRVVEVPGLDALVITGVLPARVYLYDLLGNGLHVVKNFSNDVYAAATGTVAGEAYVLGDGVVMRYRFTRQPDRRIAYSLVARARADLGGLLSAAEIPGRGVIAAGNERGELFFLDPKGLDAEPARHEVIE
jgi:predicted Ser/Thr protein kinase